jgi:uncharacterized RDD family membrane protein YckC
MTGGPLLPAGVTVSSKGRRFGAYLLDTLLLVITCGIGWIVWQLVILGKATTPGKSLLGMRMVSVDTGRPLTATETAFRELVWKFVIGSVTSSISTIVGGIMLLASDPPPQAWWDRVSKSVVVNDPGNVYGL